MQKKLIAIAVAGALGAPAVALAQASTVQVYGKATFEYSYVDPDAGKPNIDYLGTPGGVAVGFKGQEALGGGLAVWFQCESSADIRGVNQSGLCGRNSALGMKGGFGNLFLGRWDTPMKRSWVGATIGGEDTGLFGIAPLLRGDSSSYIGAASRHSWSRRQSNMISYDTPAMGGFQAMFGYSASNATAATTATTNAKPRVMSLGAVYRNGPLAIGAAYERHDEFGAVGGSNDDNAWMLSATYKLGQVEFGGSYNEQRYDMSATTSSKKKAWNLGLRWTVSGPHEIHAAYVNADDISGNGAAVDPAGGVGGITVPAAGNDTGARAYQISYVHRFSKRTYGRLGYARIDNDANARYSIYGMGVLAANGRDPSGWGAYLAHTW